VPGSAGVSIGADECSAGGREDDFTEAGLWLRSVAVVAAIPPAPDRSCTEQADRERGSDQG